MLSRLVILTGLAQKDTHLGVGAYITRIAAENLVEVVHRIGVSLMELEVTHTHIEELLRVLDALRIRIHREKILRMRLAEIVLVWMIVYKKFAFGRIEAHEHLSRLCNLGSIDLEVIGERLVRSHCRHLAVKHLSVVGHLDLCVATDLGDIGSHMDRA